MAFFFNPEQAGQDCLCGLLLGFVPAIVVLIRLCLNDITATIFLVLSSTEASPAAMTRELSFTLLNKSCAVHWNYSHENSFMSDKNWSCTHLQCQRPCTNTRNWEQKLSSQDSNWHFGIEHRSQRLLNPLCHNTTPSTDLNCLASEGIGFEEINFQFLKFVLLKVAWFYSFIPVRTLKLVS